MGPAGYENMSLSNRLKTDSTSTLYSKLTQSLWMNQLETPALQH